MSEFEIALRAQMADAWQTFTAARTGGAEYDVHQHASRVRDLLDIADRHGIDTTELVDRVELDTAIRAD